jgi:hypothetical protein
MDCELTELKNGNSMDMFAMSHKEDVRKILLELLPVGVINADENGCRRMMRNGYSYNRSKHATRRIDTK